MSTEVSCRVSSAIICLLSIHSTFIHRNLSLHLAVTTGLYNWIWIWTELVWWTLTKRFMGQTEDGWIAASLNASYTFGGGGRCNTNDNNYITVTVRITVTRGRTTTLLELELESKAKQKRFLDKGAGRSLYALQLTSNIIYTICILSVKIINKTSTFYPV